MKNKSFFLFLFLVITIVGCQNSSSQSDRGSSEFTKNDSLLDEKLDSSILYCLDKMEYYIHAEKIIDSNRDKIISAYFKKNTRKNNYVHLIVLDESIIKSAISIVDSSDCHFLLNMYSKGLIDPNLSVAFWEKQKKSVIFNIKDDSPVFIHTIIYDPDSTYKRSGIIQSNEVWLRNSWKYSKYKPDNDN